MLLEREDVNPNHADTEYGRTPLSWAAEKGHEGIVKILMQWKDIYSDVPNSINQTPSPLAPSEGYDRAVSVL